MRVEHAHAVRAAERDPGGAAQLGDGLLQRASLLALLGEAGVVDDGAVRPPLGERRILSRTRALLTQKATTSGASGRSASEG